MHKEKDWTLGAVCWWDAVSVTLESGVSVLPVVWPGGPGPVELAEWQKPRTYHLCHHQ